MINKDLVHKNQLQFTYFKCFLIADFRRLVDCLLEEVKFNLQNLRKHEVERRHMRNTSIQLKTKPCFEVSLVGPYFLSAYILCDSLLFYFNLKNEEIGKLLENNKNNNGI